jgi:D-alanyl-lipoteichoic acid acyltransferase DltB (MBOAT superfamily)
MVFSDPLFLLGFLPLSFAISHLLRAYVGGTAAVVGLVGLSMAFYAYWSVPFLLLLLAQIAANYAFGIKIERSRDKRVLAAAIVGNLALLGYFKYRNFFLQNIGDALSTHFTLATLVVPLGISFHTFQQIAMLIDLRRGAAKLPPPLNYVMFVLFFPQLIAGPIVLHQEMGKQVAAVRDGRGRGLELVAVGALIFAFGLFKKVCLADNIAQYADIAFTQGRTLMMPEAWVGVTAYALQLFFDFSGYSDMAVGLGLLFGFKLPNNFLVPYAASSIAEFWQQWHITMMRFFTMYLYQPLWLRMRRRLRSAAKDAPASATVEFAATMAFPTLVTFLLSGLWHGAGWTFICFGLVHGLGMVVNSAWKVARLASPPRTVGWALTMLVVLIGAVYFRSNDLSQAHYILHQMFFAWDNVSVPGWLAAALPVHLPIGTFTLFSELRDSVFCLAWTVLLGVLAITLPPLAANPEALMPSRTKATAMAAMVWLIIGFIGEPRTFLYFAF